MAQTWDPDRSVVVIRMEGYRSPACWYGLKVHINQPSCGLLLCSRDSHIGGSTASQAEIAKVQVCSANLIDTD